MSDPFRSPGSHLCTHVIPKDITLRLRAPAAHQHAQQFLPRFFRCQIHFRLALFTLLPDPACETGIRTHAFTAEEQGEGVEGVDTCFAFAGLGTAGARFVTFAAGGGAGGFAGAGESFEVLVFCLKN